MAENVYRFEFVDGTQGKGEEGIVDALGSGTDDDAGKGGSKKSSFYGAFATKAENTAIQQTIVSPLNTATGGLARPIYKASRTLASGGSMSTAMVGLAVAGIQLGLQALQQRVKDLEQKAESLNNTDNTLLRAGSVSKATYYTSNVFGIKQRTDRS